MKRLRRVRDYLIMIICTCDASGVFNSEKLYATVMMLFLLIWSMPWTKVGQVPLLGVFRGRGIGKKIDQLPLLSVFRSERIGKGIDHLPLLSVFRSERIGKRIDHLPLLSVFRSEKIRKTNHSPYLAFFGAYLDMALTKWRMQHVNTLWLQKKRTRNFFES